MKSKPSTAINDNAKNKHGAGHTMKHAVCRPVNPPNQGMHSSKNLSVSPTSQIGAKRVEKS